MKKNGFTWIDVLIALMIVAIMAAVAIPNLIRTRMNSNELTVPGNLRAVVAAEVAFQAAHGWYTSSFDELTQAKPAFLEGDWFNPRKGYKFSLSGTGDSFKVTAEPANLVRSGQRYFFVDESGVVRFSVSGPADNQSPVVDR